MLGPLLEKSVKANPKVTLVKLDVDAATELAGQYQVNNIHIHISTSICANVCLCRTFTWGRIFNLM